MDSGTTVDKVCRLYSWCGGWATPRLLVALTGWIWFLSLSCFNANLISFLSPPFLPTQGENARLSSFIGAIAIADLVKTTLGPKGMDKILQRISEHDQSVSVTNDGATILKSVNLDNAAAKVLVDIARVQDDEVGDGTTSVAVLCGELL